jgi:hypothetical protein
MLWQTSLPDRLFLDFGCLIFAAHFIFFLLHTTLIVICQSLLRHYPRLLIQNKILLYVTLLSELAKIFFLYPKLALVFHSSQEFQNFRFEEFVYLNL